MEHIVLTSLSTHEIKELLREELANFFEHQGQQPVLTNTTDEILNVQEVAIYLGLKVPTIYGLVSQSEIPHSKKGKRLYFSKQELLHWVKSGRRKTSAEISEEADKFLSKKGRGGYADR